MALSALPVNCQSLLQHLLDCNFELLLIGGGARALLDGEPLPTDLDFELRHSQQLADEQWLSFVSDHFDKIVSQYSCRLQKLKFGVCRIELDGCSLEFASPRIESFIDCDTGHSNFTVAVANQFDNTIALTRRDFTFNAFAWCFAHNLSSPALVDPFGGVDDWQKKLLRPCSEFCHRDPVRLLRAVRFEQKYDLIKSSNFLLQLPSFNLQQLSGHYFLRESSKVHFGQFLRRLATIVVEYSLPIPSYLSLLFRAMHDQQLGTCASIKETLFLLAVEQQIIETEFYSIVEQLCLGKKASRKIWDLAKCVVDGKIDRTSAINSLTKAEKSHATHCSERSSQRSEIN